MGRSLVETGQGSWPQAARHARVKAAYSGAVASLFKRSRARAATATRYLRPSHAQRRWTLALACADFWLVECTVDGKTSAAAGVESEKQLPFAAEVDDYH